MSLHIIRIILRQIRNVNKKWGINTHAKKGKAVKEYTSTALILLVIQRILKKGSSLLLTHVYLLYQSLHSLF